MDEKILMQSGEVFGIENVILIYRSLKTMVHHKMKQHSTGCICGSWKIGRGH